MLHLMTMKVLTLEPDSLSWHIYMQFIVPANVFEGPNATAAPLQQMF